MDRIAWITVPKGKSSEVSKMIEDADGEVLGISAEHKKRVTISCLLAPDERQKFFDKVQDKLGNEDWRMVVQATEAVIPIAEKGGEEVIEDSDGETREELIKKVSDGGRLDIPTMVLVGVSSIVAAVGMMNDSVAVVIGAMVIAPLLGPILAVILGASLGDMKLITRAVRTATVGFLIAVAIGTAAGLFVDYDPGIGQISSRSDVGPEGVALALASGTAAALSVTTGVSAALVGVMVSAALLPPAVAIGLFLGDGHLYLASGAALLFFVNVAALTLAGQVVFLTQGIRPRKWYERKAANNSVVISIAFWTVALIILVATDYLRGWLIGS